MLTAEFRRVSSIMAEPGRMTPALMRALLVVITRQTIKLEALVKKKLSGQVLNVVSGRLRRSIFHRVDTTPTSVVGSVLQSGDVKYGRIHEYGGQTSPHEIRPKNARVLAFSRNAQTVFAARVNHPGSKMPERSYMRSSLAEMRASIVADLRAAVVGALKQ